MPHQQRPHLHGCLFQITSGLSLVVKHNAMHNFRVVIFVKVNVGIAWVGTIRLAWHHVQGSSHVSITAKASVGNLADHARKVVMFRAHTKRASTNAVINATLATKNARGLVTTTNATESAEMCVTEDRVMSHVPLFLYCGHRCLSYCGEPYPLVLP